MPADDAGKRGLVRVLEEPPEQLPVGDSRLVGRHRPDRLAERGCRLNRHDSPSRPSRYLRPCHVRRPTGGYTRQTGLRRTGPGYDLLAEPLELYLAEVLRFARLDRHALGQIAGRLENVHPAKDGHAVRQSGRLSLDSERPVLVGAETARKRAGRHVALRGDGPAHADLRPRDQLQVRKWLAIGRHEPSGQRARGLEFDLHWAVFIAADHQRPGELLLRL